jgi:hypothetical protein
LTLNSSGNGRGATLVWHAICIKVFRRTELKQRLKEIKGAFEMSIQKKSLISALKTTKKANVASAPSEPDKKGTSLGTRHGVGLGNKGGAASLGTKGGAASLGTKGGAASLGTKGGAASLARIV